MPSVIKYPRSRGTSSGSFSSSVIVEYDGEGLTELSIPDGASLNVVLQQINNTFNTINTTIEEANNTSGITYDGGAGLASCFSVIDNDNLNDTLKLIADEICTNRTSIGALDTRISTNEADIAILQSELDSAEEEISVMQDDRELKETREDTTKQVLDEYIDRDKTDVTFSGLNATLDDGSGGNFTGIDKAGQYIDRASASKTLTANSDNYIDADATDTYVTAVSIGSPEPALATANSTRIYKATTDASSVTASEDRRVSEFVKEKHIADGAVTEDKLGAGAITSAKLENIVSGATIGDSDLITATFDDKGRVTAASDKINLSSLSDGDVLTWDAGAGEWNNQQVNLSSEVQSIDVEISSAEILSANSSPVTVIPTPGAGFFLDIISVSFTFSYGTVAYATNTDIAFKMGGTSDDLFSLSGVLAGTGNMFGKLQPLNPTSGTATTYKEDSFFQFYVPSGDPINGDGTMKVYISYRIVTI